MLTWTYFCRKGAFRIYRSSVWVYAPCSSMSPEWAGQGRCELRIWG